MNTVLELSFEFSLQLIVYCKKLGNSRKCVIVRQLLKSENSIEANIREAQDAESNLDFIHKLKMAAKEEKDF